MKRIFIVMFLMLSTAAIAQHEQQRPTKLAGERDAGYNISRRARVNPDQVEPFAVPEPGALLLLGAGLVSLGIYAKRKQGKKS